ncbi:MAG TPA: cation diffusion facilitator family transporter [Bacillota bacterium]|nr:cation diffusion facilitator family transporter [Bacillota bacterium]
MDNRLRLIKITSWIGIGGNIILAFVKIVLGLISGSLAVIGDGIDSATDILSFLIILFAARIIAKKPDRTHPYGHTRAEPIATMIIAFIVLYAGLELFKTAFAKLTAGTVSEIPSILAIYATILSISGKIFLATFQWNIGRRTASPMLIANARNMFNDILISSGVLLGLIFTFWFRSTFIDPLIALGVSLWVVRTAVKIFLENYTELMEGIEDLSLYQQIFSAVKEVPNAFNPHRTRIRKLANLFAIDMDIEVPPDLSVREGHFIATQVESEIKAKIPSVYDVSVHIEPLGNTEEDEKFGLTEKHF